MGVFSPPFFFLLNECQQINANNQGYLPKPLIGSLCRQTRLILYVCFSQMAYLENLLKVYNDEICRLQQAELSLDDLGTEESLYIQEHKLKRKVRQGG